MAEWLSDVVNRNGAALDRRAVQKPRRETHVSAFMCPANAFTPAVKRMVSGQGDEHTSSKHKEKHHKKKANRWFSKIQKHFV